MPRVTTQPRPVTAQYVTAKEVGGWLGKSLASVRKYRLEEHSPRPDTYEAGVRPRWLRTREADWHKWYATYGPGRRRQLRTKCPEERLKIAKELKVKYEAGASIRVLRADSGLGHGTVVRLLDEAGARIRGGGKLRQPGKSLRAMSPADRLKLAEDLRAKYEAGATVYTLNAECGLSVGAVGKLLAEANTPMRKRGRVAPEPPGGWRDR